MRCQWIAREQMSCTIRQYLLPIVEFTSMGYNRHFIRYFPIKLVVYDIREYNKFKKLINQQYAENELRVYS